VGIRHLNCDNGGAGVGFAPTTSGFELWPHPWGPRAEPMTVAICLPTTEVISIDAMASVDTVVWRCPAGPRPARQPWVDTAAGRFAAGRFGGGGPSKRCSSRRAACSSMACACQSSVENSPLWPLTDPGPWQCRTASRFDPGPRLTAVHYGKRQNSGGSARSRVALESHQNRGTPEAQGGRSTSPPDRPQSQGPTEPPSTAALRPAEQSA
jgi:hypothetical protein